MAAPKICLKKKRAIAKKNKLFKKLWKKRNVLPKKYKKCKTKVCTDCGKRKKITEFYFNKPPIIPKIAVRSDGRRCDCKKCHYAKNNKRYKSRTTKEQRRVYMLKYMRDYTDVQTYLVAA